MELMQMIKSTLKDFYLIKLIITQKKLNNEFYKELSLLNGKHKSDSSHSSILFFTLHKCASVYVTKILYELVEDTDITPINFDGYFWKTAKSPKTVEKQLKQAFKPVGYLYGPFRAINLLPKMQEMGGYRFIDSIDNYKILLMMRDPRDVLTSKYFSLAYSHNVPKLQEEQMLTKREDTLKMTLDEFVTTRSQGELNKYTEYCRELIGKPNVLFVKYEDMVNNFDTWLHTIIKYLELDVSQEKVNKIISEADFTVDKEDIHSHKRQVAPGDHKRKLKSESIDTLNSQFGEVLDLLGYEI